MNRFGPYIEHLFDEEVQPLYRQHQNWITCSIDHSIAWPEKDVAVVYSGTQFFLRGIKQQERDSTACISVRLIEGVSKHETLNLLYRFVSILGWYKGGYVDIGGYVYGSYPILCSAAYSSQQSFMQSGKYGFSCNYMPVIEDEFTRIALAFWREGLKLFYIHKGYSFLSFYKVIESQFTKGKGKANWITTALPSLEGKAKDRIIELENEGIDVSKHVFSSGRCAVAHASSGEEIVDPDIPEDKERISKDLDIIMGLAKKFIRDELKVPDEMDALKERNSLEPFESYLEHEHVQTLCSGGSILKKKLGINGLQVSVNEWPKPPIQGLEDMQLRVLSAHNGVVTVAANSTFGVTLLFAFDFNAGKAHTRLEQSGFGTINPDDYQINEVAFLKYQKAVIGNGLIELKLPCGAVVDCEVVIPVNIDIGRSFIAIDERIAKLEKK